MECYGNLIKNLGEDMPQTVDIFEAIKQIATEKSINMPNKDFPLLEHADRKQFYKNDNTLYFNARTATGPCFCFILRTFAIANIKNVHKIQKHTDTNKNTDSTVNCNSPITQMGESVQLKYRRVLFYSNCNEIFRRRWR